MLDDVSKLQENGKKPASFRDVAVNILLPIFYYIIAISQAFLITWSVSHGVFTFLEIQRLLAFILVCIAYMLHMVIEKREKQIHQLIETSNKLLDQNQALGQSYNNLVDVVDKINKDVLHQHGIYIQVARPKPPIN
jgi:hypothetical protein